jgi:toxin CptA
MTSAPAIGFDYRPSRLPGRLLGIVGALCLIAIGLCGAPLALKLALMAGNLSLASIAIRRTRRSRVVGAGCGPEGWAIYRADRSQLLARLLSHRVIGTCVLLRLRTDNTIETLLLAPDNSDDDIRRRLRMRLATRSPVAEIL